MNRCLIDTGPMVALFNSSDLYHQKSLDFMRGFNGILITSLACITETVYLLGSSTHAQLKFLHWIERGGVHIESIDTYDFQELISKFEKYSDLPVDFADGCLLVIAERLGIQDIATVDGDFEIYRLSRNRKFKIHVKNRV